VDFGVLSGVEIIRSSTIPKPELVGYELLGDQLSTNIVCLVFLWIKMTYRLWLTVKKSLWLVGL